MLDELKKEVLKANLELKKSGLVILTWGNASALDRKTGYMVIKPSGVPYETMTADDMVVVDMNGKVIEGKLNPSSDTPTHIELYKAHPEIGGIVHTHSFHAVAWAQSGRSLPCFGTTHADTFYGPVSCTRALTKEEIETAYEKNTGCVINETIADKDVLACPGILVFNHGPFTWGKTVKDAVYNAIVLENICGMATETLLINPETTEIGRYIMDKHYFRKHGKNAYYGQK